MAPQLVAYFEKKKWNYSSLDKGQGINVGSKDLEAIFENGSDTNVEKLLSLENPFNLFEIPNQV